MVKTKGRRTIKHPCECQIPNGGYCERHGVVKHQKWVTLCRTDPNYFAAWENGTGPGQPIPPDAKIPESTPSVKNFVNPRPCGGCGDKKKALTLMGEAWDVGKALVSFTLSGFKFVDREEYQRRLDICTACENRGDERVRGNPHRCGECGCFVAVKAQAVAWECTIGEWSVRDSEQNAPNADLNAR